MNTAAARAVQAAHDLIEKVSKPKEEEREGDQGGTESSGCCILLKTFCMFFKEWVGIFPKICWVMLVYLNPFLGRNIFKPLDMFGKVLNHQLVLGFKGLFANKVRAFFG